MNIMDVRNTHLGVRIWNKLSFQSKNKEEKEKRDSGCISLVTGFNADHRRKILVDDNCGWINPHNPWIAGQGNKIILAFISTFIWHLYMEDNVESKIELDWHSLESN